MKLPLLAVSLALLSLPVRSQQTIHVPGDAPTIQLGIVLAQDGDTVLVEPGTYQERIDFLGKAITVKASGSSPWSPYPCTITSEGLLPFASHPYYSTVRFLSGEGRGSVIDGFEITGISTLGVFEDEAAVWCTGTPTIKNCFIRDNVSACGIAGPAYVYDCVIRNNLNSRQFGGGIRDASEVVGCLIEGNYGERGGGIYMSGGVVSNCVIRGNGAEFAGGAHLGNAIMQRCVVTQNAAVDSEGAGHTDGGGVWGGTVIHSSVYGNTAYSFAGSAVNSGGVYGATVIGSVVWGNTNELGFDSAQVKSCVISSSCVQGGHPGLGNIDADPLFFDAANGDFRLLPNSPCIDSGDPLSDLDPDGTIADMGAIPFDQYPICQPAQAKLSATAPFDHVGSSIAASGPYVLAGISDVDGVGIESGAASLAYRDGEDWIKLPMLLASDAAVADLFGWSVAIDGGAALLGARGSSSEAGAAYVFRQQPDGTWAEDAKLVANDAVAGEWLGSRVAISADVAAASALHADALGADSGAVYVFRDGGSGWTQEQKLVGLDTVAGDQFGKGLAMSAGRILVGAYGDDDAGPDSGSAYVFRDDGGFLTQEAKLTASDATTTALFGNEVALDGDLAVVAARSDSGVGAVYVFRRTGASWSQEQKLTASTPFANAEFGSAVAVSGDQILVGAKLDDSAANDAGAAYLFEFNGSAWIETAKYTLATAAPGDRLGSSVALSGGYAMVGAEWADDPELDSGELWAFPLPETCAPKVTSTQPTSAQFPDAVTATGQFLGQTQSVLVDGLPASLVSASEFEITYQPQPGAPGHVALEASGPDGTATATQQMYPSLEATTTGIGGTIDVTLDNGDVGLYALAFGTGVFPAPFPIASPPTWYGVLLDITQPVFTASSGAFATPDPVGLSFPVPNNPAWAGLTLHFQAWCQQGLFGSVTASFTNAVGVTF